MTAPTLAHRARQIIEANGPMTSEVFIGHMGIERERASRVLDHLCHSKQICYIGKKGSGVYGWLEPKPKVVRKYPGRGIVARAVSTRSVLAACWGGA